MTHEEARALFASAALDDLTATERAGLESHVAGCAECAQELARVTDAAHELAHAAPVAPLDPGRAARLRARLLARAAAGHTGSDAAAPRAIPAVVPLRPAARFGAARLLAAAGIVVVVAGTVYYALSEHDRADRLAARVTEFIQGDRTLQAQLDTQRVTLAARDRLIGALTGPGVRVIEVGAPSTQATGRMFWDQPTGDWTFVAHHLRQAPPGRTYQLWLVTRDQRKVSAGTFVAAAGGDAVVSARYALSPDSLAAVAVTEEPAGGSPQPTSQPFLVGAARSAR